MELYVYQFIIVSSGFHVKTQKSCSVRLPRESINSLKRKYSRSSEATESDAAIERTLNEVVKEGCQFLLDEVFLDLEVRADVGVCLHS